MVGTHPPWLKVRPPGGERYTKIKSIARQLDLHTVCEEAHCPNVGECWGGGTATFMAMGRVCTRGCRFCAVNTARSGGPLDPNEPAHLAEAIEQMGLDYVVLTSVNRDDLADQGAHHLAQCIETIREICPKTLLEVLIPDFRGDEACLDRVVRAGAEVVAHNVECVERLTPKVRDPRATYAQSLEVLATIKRLDETRFTKSSIMVGVGETEEEVVATMRDLRAAGTDVLTVGQYLRPSARHLPMVAHIPPEQFERYEQLGLEQGFAFVASGPLVRSSYKAGELFLANLVRSQDQPTRLSSDPPSPGFAK